MLLKDKVALVTGAGNGIGQATAIRFAAEGAKVVLSDIDGDSLTETLDRIESMGGEATQVSGNVTSREDVQRMVDVTLETYDRIDLLINNAGITRDALTTRIKDDTIKLMTDEQWDMVLDVNLKGTWLCSQLAAIPMIKQKSGRIVNTASTSALGHFGQANYSASKAGVIALSKTFALEWARHGIAVNCIAPGAVETRMTAAIPDKLAEGLLSRIPYGRMADPDEIASVHVFLCSDLASYITGQVIFVDGGLTL